MFTLGLVVALFLTGVLGATAGGTVPLDAPNQPPFLLYSLGEHCDDQTGAAIVASVGSEYRFTLRPRSEIDLPSEIPLAIRIAYRGGALTCYPPIIPPEGSTRPQIPAQLGVVMHVGFFTEGGAFSEQFDAEFKGRSGGVSFSYSTAPDKLQGTYRPDLPEFADVSVGFAGSFGGETNGEVNESGIPPGHVSEYIPVARWATYLDQTPTPTSKPTPTEAPTSDACPKNVSLTATEGPVGSTVELMGWCTTIQSGSHTAVFFEDEAVGSLVVDTTGSYQAEFQVPLSAAHGTHAVRVWAAGVEIGSAAFRVTHPALPCVGDCDGTRALGVDQLITMVNVGLGNAPIAACAGGDADGSETIEVNEIITAVENALDGCSPSHWGESCHDQTECNRDPLSRCVEAGVSEICNSCWRLPAECLQDTDCARYGAGFVCAPAGASYCSCVPSTLICVPGCASSADCSVGEVCNEAARCVPRPCTSNQECAQRFTCVAANDSSNRSCQRVQCRTDADCVEGFCLAGQCFGQLGTCVPGST